MSRRVRVARPGALVAPVPPVDTYCDRVVNYFPDYGEGRR
jgi:hypothetical protein